MSSVYVLRVDSARDSRYNEFDVGNVAASMMFIRWLKVTEACLDAAFRREEAGFFVCA